MKIANENDLRRENLKAAWALLRPLKPEEMERLTIETIKQWRKDAGLVDESIAGEKEVAA